jgi:hypothetical protein
MYCRSDRNGKPESLILDGEEECEPFWELLGGKGPIKPAVEDTVPLPTGTWLYLLLLLHCLMHTDYIV